MRVKAHQAKYVQLWVPNLVITPIFTIYNHNITCFVLIQMLKSKQSISQMTFALKLASEPV